MADEHASPSVLAPPGQVTTIKTTAQVQDLCRWILERGRARPVVVLTARNTEQHPFFSPRDVLALVGDAGDVVVIGGLPGSTLTVALQRRLPDGLGVYNGAARIYWPIDLAGTSPSVHPLVRADSDTSSMAEKRARLAGRWRQPPSPSSPARPGAVRLVPPLPATEPEAPPVPAIPVPAAVDVADVGPGEDALRVAIVAEWLALLPDPADRNRFGLGPYRLHRELAAQLEVHSPARELVAAAAARVLSGYAWTQPAPVPVRVEQDGAPVLRDGDRAVAWRYPLTGTDLVLFYWQPAAGPIVLARVGAADHVTLPDHAAPAPGPATAPEIPPLAPAAGEDPRIVQLVAAAEAQRQETDRLRAIVEGRSAPTPAPPAPTPVREIADPRARAAAARRVFDVADDVLVSALRDAGRPLSSRELRAALGVDPDVPAHHLTRVLNRALEAGLIVRIGERAGAKYTPA